MPEYLAPGVYVEEVSFRSKSIEGVATSTTGFAGMTRFGPVYFAGGPTSSEPRLVTSFTEFERVYGGLDPLWVGGGERLPYLAHAARAFFANGGVRLYVSRVYVPPGAGTGVATMPPVTVTVGAAAPRWRWKARWPGDDGNVLVEVEVVRSKNVAYQKTVSAGPPVLRTQAQRAKAGAVVEITNGGAPVKAVVRIGSDGLQTFHGSAGVLTPPSTATIVLLELRVKVTASQDRLDVYDGLGLDPAQVRYIGKILSADDPEDENAVVFFDWPVLPGALPADDFLPAALLASFEVNASVRLEGGDDGGIATGDAVAGAPSHPDIATQKATGLAALGEIEDIAIVAAPDGGTLATPDECAAVASALIAHAETLKYRIAVVDAPQGSSMTEIRVFRGRFDSKYAALYHPWVEIFDPTQRPSQGAPPARLMLPPSGFVCGIYARSDIERGVHKAPANEVVRGLTRFEANVNKPRQDVLNPEGINALRFFEGRGSRVWGARTMSSDPEWKYVNVRRLFAYMEHSIDRGTQWAVFEPNNSRLWANVRQTIEDFLLVLWKDGALLGDTPEEAFFVRCDRTTMTQNDIDNGRMIALIGVAPTKPAEFVIFRIGQFTAGGTG